MRKWWNVNWGDVNKHPKCAYILLGQSISYLESSELLNQAQCLQSGRLATNQQGDVLCLLFVLFVWVCHNFTNSYIWAFSSLHEPLWAFMSLYKPPFLLNLAPPWSRWQGCSQFLVNKLANYQQTIKFKVSMEASSFVVSIAYNCRPYIANI